MEGASNKHCKDDEPAAGPACETPSSSAQSLLTSDGLTKDPSHYSCLTNENVKKLSENGDSQENEEETGEKDDGDDSSDISELSDLSHESWQPVRGPIAWVQEQMRKGQSPRKILENLVPKGTMIPDGLDAVMLWKIIINIISEPPKRKKLQDVNTLDDVLHLFKTCKKIIVLTGAGVSVSCGIPDFRSRDGVYARLAKDFPNLPDPQAMFDIHFFRSDPRPFFKFAKEIYPGQFRPSPCHHFIRLLETKGKLLRNYTQNIDTLEQVAGIERIIQCHGSFATATCAVCGHRVDSSVIKEDIFKQVIPKCPNCPSNKEEAVMKPDIVFFGESLPEHFHNQMAADKEDCDLLIVIGSSLKVRPVALIPNSLPAHIPQILINRERLPYLSFDVELLGDCDRIVAELCRRLGEGWDHLASKGPPLDQVLLSNLPTPPASPELSRDKGGGGDTLVSSSSNTESCISQAGPSHASDVTKSHHHHHHHHHNHHHHHHHHQRKSAEKSVPVSSSCSLEEQTETLEDRVSSSSGLDDSAQTPEPKEAIDRLVSAGHKKDVVYMPGKQSSTASVHNQEHHHYHHASSSSLGSTSHINSHSHDHNHQSLSVTRPGHSGSDLQTSREASSSEQQSLSPRKRSNTNERHGDVDVKRARVSEEVTPTDSSATGATSQCVLSGQPPAEEPQPGSDEPQVSGDEEDGEFDLAQLWANRPRVSIAERLANNQMLFLPPSRYVFKGAEVYSDDSESEDDDDDDDDQSSNGAAEGTSSSNPSTFDRSKANMASTSAEPSSSCATESKDILSEAVSEEVKGPGTTAVSSEDGKTDRQEEEGGETALGVNKTNNEVQACLGSTREGESSQGKASSCSVTSKHAPNQRSSTVSSSEDIS